MKPLFIAFTLLALTIIARADELLITAPGKYAHHEGKSAIEVSQAGPDHILWRITFKTERVDQTTGMKLTGSRSIGSQEPLPIAREKWAVCFVSDREVWLYDGKESVLSYKSGEDGIIQSSKCADPEIEARSPAALKKWIREKKPNRPPQTTSANLRD